MRRQLRTQFRGHDPFWSVVAQPLAFHPDPYAGILKPG
jgi:hypothetical protein